MTAMTPAPHRRFRSPWPRRGRAEDPASAMRGYLDRFFEDLPVPWAGAWGGMEGFLSPDVDVSETQTGLEVKADLPGLKPEDISLDVADGILTLKAEKRSEREESDEKKTWHLVERSAGTYLRRIALPFVPDEERIEARFENGVLKVSVPRSKEPDGRTRRIEIKGA